MNVGQKIEHHRTFNIDLSTSNQKHRGGSMRKKTIWARVMVSISLLLFLATGNAWAQVKVGEEAPAFILLETDRSGGSNLEFKPAKPGEKRPGSQEACESKKEKGRSIGDGLEKLFKN
jgi:hypothetical protein